MGVPPPVLPFVHLHKPHDRMNTLVSPIPHLAFLPFAFAANDWPTSTSLTENLWQWCVLATPLQQLLGMNVAATNQWTLDVQLVVDAKPKTAGEIGRAANG